MKKSDYKITVNYYFEDLYKQKIKNEIRKNPYVKEYIDFFSLSKERYIYQIAETFFHCLIDNDMKNYVKLSDFPNKLYNYNRDSGEDLFYFSKNWPYFHIVQVKTFESRNITWSKIRAQCKKSLENSFGKKRGSNEENTSDASVFQKKHDLKQNAKYIAWIKRNKETKDLESNSRNAISKYLEIRKKDNMSIFGDKFCQTWMLTPYIDQTKEEEEIIIDQTKHTVPKNKTHKAKLYRVKDWDNSGKIKLNE